jgi:UDP-N-acetyl-D-mannosaminouronate:lipid I N-acetyl-D-mannosaminouronosyltransferase
MESTTIKGIRLYSPDSIDSLITSALKSKVILVAVNAEKILMADKAFSNFISKNIGYPDGIGAVWLLRRRGFSYAKRIPGVELWLNIINARYLKNTFYLVGGKEEVIQKTVDSLKVEFPGFRLLGFRNGYITTIEQRTALKNDILDKKPDIVFVAMGSPIQEELMQELHAAHPAVYQGLGGSFDVYTGRVERAPEWWRNNNLEWAYRLYKEPWRIKRQIHLIKFLPYLIYNKK